MARFLVDEDLPRSLAAAAQAKGVDATHVVDAGLLVLVAAGHRTGSLIDGCC